MADVFYKRGSVLDDADFGASDVLAAEGLELLGFKLNDTVAGSVDGEVAAQGRTVAGALGHTDLADDNLTGLDDLATKQLNPKALTWTVSGIFGCTAGFNV